MERRARVRIVAFICLILVIFGLFTFRLYKLQSSLDEQAMIEADSHTYWTYVDAARGQILDRNGTVLVTNRASYNLVIVNFPLFNSDDINGSVLQLLDTCEELGIEPISHFPVTEEKPYTYTLESYSSAWQNYFRRFLRSRSWDTDISAQTLVRNLKEAYNVPDSWSDEDTYRLIQLRYELSLRAVDNMPLGNYVLAEDVSAEALASIMELGIPGVIVETTTVRDYRTTYAAHLLGYTGPMNSTEYENTYKEQGYDMDAVVGKEGVERAFESYLHGVDGLKSTTVSSSGEVLNESYLSVPQPGSNVELTIDIDLSAAAATALENCILDLQENGVGRSHEGKDADSGAVVAIDVKTGEVLVMESYPSFDLSRFNELFDELNADPALPMFNRALLAEYPPGSVYKMVTAITAMDTANVGPHFEVYDEGKYTKFEAEEYVPACHIWTSYGITHGDQNIMDAISNSCNYYFYEVGLMVATEDVDYVAMKLGLGESTGIELYEETGTRANAESKAKVYANDLEHATWVEGDKLSASIGQSINEFTPMQLACYMAALANGGTRYNATLLSRVVSWNYSELLEENTPTVASQLEISEAALKAVVEGMVMAADEGTANTFLQDYPITVAAKTGTAQHGTGGSDHASFVCYAPVEDPQIAIAVYVEHGSQGGNLGQVAKAILDAYFSLESQYELSQSENTIG